MWRSEDNLSPSIMGSGAPVRVVRFVWLALLPTEPSILLANCILLKDPGPWLR